MTWRERAVEVVRQVVEENPGLDDLLLRRRVAEAYPFGPKTNHPYKAWLRAVEDVLGPSERKRAATRRRVVTRERNLGQGGLDLFS